MSSSGFSMGQAFDWGMATFKKNAAFLIGVVIVIFAVCYVPSVLGWLLRLTHAIDPRRIPIVVVATMVIWLIPIGVLGTGMIRIVLKLADGQQPRFADLFGSARLLWRWIAVQILVLLIVCAGLVLFIIPGYVWAIRFGFAPIIIVDSDVGVIESLRRSSEITQGRRLSLFAFELLVTVLIMVGTCALLVGLLVALPIAALARVHVYRQLVYGLANETLPTLDEEPGVGTGEPIPMPQSGFGDWS